jgi:hypothetical protein
MAVNIFSSEGFLPTDVSGVFFCPMSRCSSPYDIISMDARSRHHILHRAEGNTSVYLMNTSKNDRVEYFKVVLLVLR